MSANPSVWQQQLAEAIDSLDVLCELLKLDRSALPPLPNLDEFPLRVPRSFVARMTLGDPRDPLLLQVLPVADEQLVVPGYTLDAVGDLNASVDAGVLHKYHGRVLLITTGGCAVHCRYCFRRHFPYSELQLSTQKRSQALAYIADNPDISEVILSGGDPLLLSDGKLSELLDAIAGIPHVKRIRIHSRIPIVLPARITSELIQHWQALDKPLILVIHANHAQELNTEVADVLAALRAAGITLLNQSVLLRAVNDQVDALCQLSEQLFANGVLPYYLHLLDKTAGTAHFDITESTAKQLLVSMQNRLPGYLVPKLVREQTGALHKILL